MSSLFCKKWCIIAFSIFGVTRTRQGKENRGGRFMDSGSLLEEAYRSIRKQILTCEIMLVDIISIYNLSEKLQMSRTPISNAISRLEREGLVQTLRNRGVLVKEISTREVIEMFEIYQAHQLYVLEVVKENSMYKFDLDKLSTIVQQQKEAKARGDYLAYADLSLQFFRNFVITIHNQVLLQITDTHHDKIYMYSVARYKLFPQQRVFSGLTFNTAMHQALTDRDFDHARQLTKDHYRELRERLIMRG